MMKDIGKKIQQAREAKGLKLDEIRTRTRINLSYIEAIERGEFDFLPLPYVIGFIKNIALVLELDGEKLVEPLRVRQVVETAKQTEVRDSLEDDALITPSEVITKSPYSFEWKSLSEIPYLKEISAALAIVLVIIMLFVVSSTSGDDPADSAKGALETQAEKAGQVKEIPFEQIMKEAEKKSAQVDHQASNANQELVLKVFVKDTAWIRVVIDDNVTKDSIYHPGETEVWTAKTGFRMRIGNAGAVRLTLNGRTMEDIGAPGQVAEIYLNRSGIVEKKLENVSASRSNS